MSDLVGFIGQKPKINCLRFRNRVLKGEDWRFDVIGRLHHQPLYPDWNEVTFEYRLKYRRGWYKLFEIYRGFVKPNDNLLISSYVELGCKSYSQILLPNGERGMEDSLTRLSLEEAKSLSYTCSNSSRRSGYLARVSNPIQFLDLNFLTKEMRTWIITFGQIPMEERDFQALLKEFVPK